MSESNLKPDEVEHIIKGTGAYDHDFETGQVPDRDVVVDKRITIQVKRRLNDFLKGDE